MLKKVVYGIVAGSLVFAAQSALANDQYWTGERWQPVSGLPFDAFTKTKEGVAGRPGITSEAGPKGEPGMLKVGVPSTAFPAPYDNDGRNFN